MKKLSHRDWAILIVAAICFGTIGFALKGVFTTPTIETDNSGIEKKYELIFDSIKKEKLKSDFRVYLLEKTVDSLKGLKVINHINLKHETGKIKLFTPSARDKWNDSVTTLEGAR